MVEIIRADLNNPGHAEALISLMRSYAQDKMGGGKDLSSYVQANLVQSLNHRNGTHIILAYLEDQAIGLATCFEGFSTFACKPLLNIHDVIINHQHRGKGISRLLLNEAETIADEIGCCKMTLEVLEGNEVAKAAYSSFGFHGYELNPQMGKALFWEKSL